MHLDADINLRRVLGIWVFSLHSLTLYDLLYYSSPVRDPVNTIPSFLGDFDSLQFIGLFLALIAF